MRVHAIQTGNQVGNETLMRDMRWRSHLRRRRPYRYPGFSFLIEHEEGPILIDTGLSMDAEPSRVHRMLSIPVPEIGPDEEIGPMMRAAGLDPGGVPRVVLTHLHPDHAGGIGYFPEAEFLVHRREHEFASTPMGRFMFMPRLWPDWFAPTLFDLDDGPYGPFPESKAVTERGDVRLVPLPGHTIGQVGVVVETGDRCLFLTADHFLRLDWFLEDYAAGRLLCLAVHPKLSPETSRRVHRFMEETPAVVLPSHDEEVPARLESREPVTVRGGES